MLCEHTPEKFISSNQFHANEFSLCMKPDAWVLFLWCARQL